MKGLNSSRKEVKKPKRLPKQQALVKSKSKLKPNGKCPHCHEVVRARVVEENSWSRDVCECPSCSERVLVCSYPGCTDFVVGGDYWDNALCPEHGKELTDRAKELGTTVAMLLVTLWTKSKFTKK